MNFHMRQLEQQVAERDEIIQNLEDKLAKGQLDSEQILREVMQIYIGLLPYFLISILSLDVNFERKARAIEESRRARREIISQWGCS